MMGSVGLSQADTSMDFLSPKPPSHDDMRIFEKWLRLEEEKWNFMNPVVRDRKFYVIASANQMVRGSVSDSGRSGQNEL